MRYRIIEKILIGLAVVTLAACGGSDGGSALTAVTKQETAVRAETLAISDNAVLKKVAAQASGAPLKGYASSQNIWPSNRIPVCWKLNSQEMLQISQEREWVRSAIADTWEAASDVKFTG